MATQASQTQQEDIKKQMKLEQEQIRVRMNMIKNKILVLSGKGGVGKSTVSVNLAISLALQVRRSGCSILIFTVHMIKQFLKDVQWGQLDYLIVDSPPGTGDEPLSIVQLLESCTGAVIVTTPQELALSDVRKGITFCRNLNVNVLGVIKNMSGFICPKCGNKTDIFKSGGGEKMAEEMGVPFLGRIPIDPAIVDACDSGKPYIQQYKDSQTALAFKQSIVNFI
ncbi:antiporter inner membrane protein [Limihaloglobus sulfuriphilus]|uniref:Antiporter inner membrane protein n=1 Tax=Limihaloglobus sulfuriphilus TaxID=1851148 RepID=A0A1Q2MGI9_9BACT|nr:Mrp/NBP35 family ATP-binding protein [Limihaloglobus sulfuriphilus]AQQ71801.1 antiporter inner membrane protein [Limihaloglobus sulfuriphilus]